MYSSFSLSSHSSQSDSSKKMRHRYSLRSQSRTSEKTRKDKRTLSVETEADEDFMESLDSLSPMEPSPVRTTAFNSGRLLRKRFSESNMFRHSDVVELEGILLFKERPRQFILLVTAVAMVAHYSFAHDSNDLSQNVRSALLSAGFIFLSYCFLQTRDGLLVRPHPGVWRIVHGCSVLYLIMLAALSVQNVGNARKALQILFPEIGGQKKEAVPMDCSINASNLFRGVSSIWFLAHVTGWWGKMCMFRDWRVCWVLSIAFELIECSLQFIIPDFAECWWDSLFLDMFGANMIGMLLGKLTLNLLETRNYDWSGYEAGQMGFMRRALDQFSPFSWSRYNWAVFSSFKRFAQVMLILFVCLAAELNAFFLLCTLQVPKESHLNKYRLALIFLLGIPAASEYYEFISDPNCWRVGQNAWMMCSIVLFEILVWVKFLPSLLETSAPPPAEVTVPISIFATLFGTWVILFFCFKNSFQSHTSKRMGLLDIVFWAAFLPLLYLTKQWVY